MFCKKETSENISTLNPSVTVMKCTTITELWMWVFSHVYLIY